MRPDGKIQIVIEAGFMDLSNHFQNILKILQKSFKGELSQKKSRPLKK